MVVNKANLRHNSSSGSSSKSTWASAAAGSLKLVAADSSSDEGQGSGKDRVSTSAATQTTSAAAVTPAVFQGSGEGALEALERLVVQHVVSKPHLTVMQLQRAVQGISRLDSPCQLAAIGVLIRAGCWLAGMQVRVHGLLETRLA